MTPPPALRSSTAGLMPGDHPLHGLVRRAADHSGAAKSARLTIGRNDVHPFPRRLQWKLPGRYGGWLTPPPSPPGPQPPGRHDERGIGTFNWPPAGTFTWPHLGISHGHGHARARRHSAEAAGTGSLAAFIMIGGQRPPCRAVAATADARRDRQLMFELVSFGVPQGDLRGSKPPTDAHVSAPSGSAGSSGMLMYMSLSTPSSLS